MYVCPLSILSVLQVRISSDSNYCTGSELATRVRILIWIRPLGLTENCTLKVKGRKSQALVRENLFTVKSLKCCINFIEGKK